MYIIGIAGGVASGKSLVAECFERPGAVAFNADRAAHEVLLEPEVERAVRGRWGDRAFGADGHVDRAVLAKIVFAPAPDGPEELAYLEQIIHPRVQRRFRRRIEELAARGTVKAVLVDAPMLFEAGWVPHCDKIVFVQTPRSVRLARAVARGWTENDFSAREAAQESLDAKRSQADVVIDNSGSIDRTHSQVKAFWDSLG